MDSQRLEDMRLVYSLLPDEDTESAAQDTLRLLAEEQTVSQSAVLKWVEFRADGSFSRGGATEIGAGFTDIFFSPDEDSEVADLVSDANEFGFAPGRVSYFHERKHFYWFLPASRFGEDVFSDWYVKAFIVSEALFARLLQHFNSNHRVTLAEWRVGFQLVAGVGATRAAEDDDVSVETKRAQIKSLCSKMMCSGQVNLVRLLVGQLFHVTTLAESESTERSEAEAFIARYLSDDVSFRIHRLPNKKLLRIVECGRPDATPIVLIHGVMFPQALFGVRETLDRFGLRLIIPIRSGYFTNRDRVGDLGGNCAVESIDEITAFIKLNFSNPPLMIGQSYGAVIALRLAAEHPECVKQLLLMSPQFLSWPAKTIA